MIRGAYQSLRPGDDAVEQADLLLSRIGTLAPGDLPPALHVEVTDGESPATIGQAVEAWAEAVEGATGRRPFIYTNASFWNSSVSASGSSQYPLWVAHLDVACPNTPALWSDWSLWQYSASGAVPGIVGLVDRDVFNGSSTELEELAGIQAVPAMGPITRIALGLMLVGLGLTGIALRRRGNREDTQQATRTV
jgi:lysozyme